MAEQEKQRAARPKKRKRDNGESNRDHKRPRSEDAAKTSRSILKIGAEDGQEIQELESNGKSKAPWILSKPMGGRMADIDPILSSDEKFLLITYNTCIQVYTTEDSLLIRRIPIHLSPAEGVPEFPRIVSTRQSHVSHDHVWVACSDGCIFYVDWTASSSDDECGKSKHIQTNSQTCMGLAVLGVRDEQQNHQDILIVIELEKKEAALVLYKCSGGQEEAVRRRIAIIKSDDVIGLPVLEVSQTGLVVAAAWGETLYLASFNDTDTTPFGEWKCRSYMLDTNDIVCSLDLRVAPSQAEGLFVDLIVGGARGAILAYNDVLRKLSGQEKEKLLARNYHWHSRAVHALKWSRDGNYMISGGSENVLVIWQLDTGKKDFLPHLSGSIENVVVSNTGSSYVLHLDDNSTMMISTAEMKPVSYISGLQSVVSTATPNKDSLVNRVWKAWEEATAPIPAAINPRDPSKLHICVGSGQQQSVAGDVPAAPWLQTVDLESLTARGRHAIARTHPTFTTVTSKGFPVVEPRVTHIQFSTDGRWLATVDEWLPTARDIGGMAVGIQDLLKKQRREVYLKFWRVGDGDEPFALVTRINAPHGTGCTEKVFDLAARIDTTRFATVGNDGMVRTWRPLVREQDGVRIKGANGEDTHRWTTELEVDLGASARAELAQSAGLPDTRTEHTGALAFSEDGSTLFVAYGDWTSGKVNVVDTVTGSIRHVLQDVWSGRVCRLASLGAYLFALSDHMFVMDVISGGDLQFAVELPAFKQASMAKNFLQIAVDRMSGSVAVALPQDHETDVAVFRPDCDGVPVFIEPIPHRVISVVSSPTASGFLIIDDAAQAWSLTETAQRSKAMRLLHSLEDMKLDKQDEKAAIENVVMEADEGASDDEAGGRPEVEDVDEMDVDMDWDTHAAVVTKEGLAGIFEAVPAFAMGSVEDLFYRVAGLVAQKPVGAGQA